LSFMPAAQIRSATEVTEDTEKKFKKLSSVFSVTSVAPAVVLRPQEVRPDRVADEKPLAREPHVSPVVVE